MDASNPAQVKEQKISAKMVHDQELADLKEILSHSYGRRFIWRMLAWGRIGKLSFSGEDTNLTNFKEGMRNIGLMLIIECELADPSAYILMQQEAQAKEFKERVNDG